MTTIIDGTSIAKKIEAEVAARVAMLKTRGISPELHVILVGNDKPSLTYIKHKGKAAERVGISFTFHHLAETTTEEALVTAINNIQKAPQIAGLLIQIPLPEHLYTEKVLNTINPAIDIDCLTNENLGRLVMNTGFITPPTPAAALAILKDIGAAVQGKNVTVVGTGSLVGKPLAIMLMNAGASVTTVNSRTDNPQEKCLTADILITGVGKKHIITGDMIKSGAIVIDTGIVYVDDKLAGDIEFESAEKKASHITPIPGGVGPVTISRLLLNTVICAERKNP